MAHPELESCSLSRSWGVTDRLVADHLRRHLALEADALDDYESLCDSEDAHVRYAARLLLDDEQRHHALLVSMLERVDADAAWNPEPSIPWLRTPRDRRALSDAVSHLLRLERADLRAVRSLRRRLRAQRDTSLLWPLTDVLELDTRKHIRILKFLRRSSRVR